MARCFGRYTRSVTKSSQRLEALLKVIVTPQDPAEGFILNYTLLIGDASFSNFQKVRSIRLLRAHAARPYKTNSLPQILDLKGTTRAAQNDLLDSFVTITSTKPELEQTSFLTSLDMDPHPQQSQIHAFSQLGNITSPGGSRVSLPGLLVNSGESGMVSPPPGALTPTGLGTGSGADTPLRGEQKVFSDFRRFVSFGLRRDTAPQ